MRRAPFLLLCLLVGSCGATQDHPQVIATFPAYGVTLPGGLRRIRVTYDEPIRVLNPNDARVYTPYGEIATSVSAVPGNSCCLDVVAQPGVNFPSGVGYSLFVSQGFAVNADDHYARDQVFTTFTAGPDSEVLLGSPVTNRVVLADPVTFAEVSSTPTPGARRPVGLLGTEQNAVRRVWVQLGSGSGSGKSLAWFAPGDAAMTEVTLTHAGDLTATAPAIALTPDGTALFVAWRDEGLGLVRLARIDVGSATETGSILLSPAASAQTAPVSLAVDAGGTAVHVVCRAAAGARLCFVDPTAFVEHDEGPDAGVDGVPLPSGAGPMLETLGRVGIAPLGSDSRLTALYVPVGAVDGTIVGPNDAAAGPAGVNVCLTATNDALYYVQGLSGAAPKSLLLRNLADPNGSSTLDVSDDVGGVATGATMVVALGAYPSGDRFCGLLDSGVAAIFTWTTDSVSQVDVDDVTAGTQCLPLPATAAGADVIGFFLGATPP
jgi:hypothetical protein